MKKKIYTVVFLFVGSSLWWVLSNTAQSSIKKWDAKFETVIRHSFLDAGLKDADILSSVNEIQHGPHGEWIQHRWAVRDISKAEKKKIKKALENAGAKVSEIKRNNETVFLLKRGSRVYQEIRFTPLPS